MTALGSWGIRWVGELGRQDLDPHLLMWDMKRKIPVDRWPRSRTVVEFRFDDVETRVSRWWLVVSGADVDVCDHDPGFEVTATVATSLGSMVRLWRGDLSWDQLLRREARVEGPTTVRRSLPDWLGQSESALVPRPA